MKKILYVYRERDFHISESAGRLIGEDLAADGRYELEMTSDLDAFAALPGADYAAVVVYTTGCHDELRGAREAGLLQFMKAGGGFVGLHSAADSFRGSRSYLEMLNGEFLSHPAHHEFAVRILDGDHYITRRISDFQVFDELYRLQGFDADRCTVLADAGFRNERHPVVYVREYGSGRVAYLANGHTPQAWRTAAFRKLVTRSIAWTAGADGDGKTIRCGLLGYGPNFNMGRNHYGWLSAVPGLRPVAMCDIDPARVETARRECPDLELYTTRPEEMLADADLDLVVVILPHSLHEKAALQCLDAGKHVVIEKPFCITVEEANRIARRARESNLTVSVFHNRRWDPDYLAIRDVIDRGLIGEVFHVECHNGGYGHPGLSWRSDKAVSGGVLYDWGAHFLDWILNLVPAKIAQVTGTRHDRVWHGVTNEDYMKVGLRFENGVTAEFVSSRISALPQPKMADSGHAGRAGGRHDEGGAAAGELRVRCPARGRRAGSATDGVADQLLPAARRPPAAGRAQSRHARAGATGDRRHSGRRAQRRTRGRHSSFGWMRVARAHWVTYAAYRKMSSGRSASQSTRSMNGAANLHRERGAHHEGSRRGDRAGPNGSGELNGGPCRAWCRQRWLCRRRAPPDATPGIARVAPFSGVKSSSIQMTLATQFPRASGSAPMSTCNGCAAPLCGSTERAFKLLSLGSGPSRCSTESSTGG